MLSLRQKLIIAFTSLLLLIAMLAGIGLIVTSRMSQSFDQIFRENLASITAANHMRENIEEINQKLVISLWGGIPLDTTLIYINQSAFQKELAFQNGNITVQGERQFTDSLNLSWTNFCRDFSENTQSNLSNLDKRTHYQQIIKPNIFHIQRYTQKIAELNAQNMLSKDGQIRSQARKARDGVYLLLGSSAFMILILFIMLGQSILKPIKALTRSAKEIEKGNLDLSVDVHSTDELGQLAEAFNSMAAKLREFRRTDQAKFIRIQKTTQTAINTLPDAIAVINSTGIVELSNESAKKLFGIKPGKRIEYMDFEWLIPLYEKVCREVRAFHPQSFKSAIQIFKDSQEKFYLPHLIPILDETNQLTGITLVLADVTDLRRIDETKSDLLSTVSHELKTRLTSVRIALHLMLDDKLGELNSKQTELALTARDDCEHLYKIIEGLLDISRISSGKMKMELVKVSIDEVIRQCMENFHHSYQDKGVHLNYECALDLSDVWADTIRMPLILENLLSNALKCTSAGGNVYIHTQNENNFVKITVTDNGIGISPTDIPHIFEKFYRGISANNNTGAGLGLAIAKEIVESHGGLIMVESQLGVGSTFSFTLKRFDPQGV